MDMCMKSKVVSENKVELANLNDHTKNKGMWIFAKLCTPSAKSRVHAMTSNLQDPYLSYEPNMIVYSLLSTYI